MKKRILSVLLALCMCLTFVPVSVFAEDLQQDNSISVLSITPDEGTYCTYVFTVDSKEIDRQIVKNGDTLLEPQVPAQDGKVFTGWSPEVTFGTVSGLTGKNKTITVEASSRTAITSTLRTTMAVSSPPRRAKPMIPSPLPT